MNEALPQDKAALIAAYLATAYHVRIDGVIYVLRVNQLHEQLDAWLEARRYPGWAWLTAVNPASRILSDEENRARLDDLERLLRQSGLCFFPAEGVADAAGGWHWPNEAAVFVPGLDVATAFGMARAFGQNAWLAGRVGEPAQLCWLADFVV